MVTVTVVFNLLSLLLIAGAVWFWLHQRNLKRSFGAFKSVSPSCEGWIHSKCMEEPCSCKCHVESIPPRIRR